MFASGAHTRRSVCPDLAPRPDPTFHHTVDAKAKLATGLRQEPRQ
jgi:hypothetical protein